MPFENSTNGSVVYTLDLFADRQYEYTNVYVCGEAFLDVHHCLVGHESSSAEKLESPGDITPTTDHPSPSRPRVKPLTNLHSVTRIYSHPQAFGQCEAFLSSYLKGIERQEASSTAKAAEIVSTDSTKTFAAISSKLAAQMNDLDVLAEGIEDRDDNATRFFILRRDPAPGDYGANDVQQHKDEQRKWKTLVAFTINHKVPGALADALMVFKTHALNLTSINSRPSRIVQWHYIFFVEFEGKREVNGAGGVNSALEELQAATEGCRWYGSWIDKASR